MGGVVGSPGTIVGGSVGEGDGGGVPGDGAGVVGGSVTKGVGAEVTAGQTS